MTKTGILFATNGKQYIYVISQGLKYDTIHVQLLLKNCILDFLESWDLFKQLSYSRENT